MERHGSAVPDGINRVGERFPSTKVLGYFLSPFGLTLFAARSQGTPFTVANALSTISAAR